jgi:hypothetical protein
MISHLVPARVRRNGQAAYPARQLVHPGPAAQLAPVARRVLAAFPAQGQDLRHDPVDFRVEAVSRAVHRDPVAYLDRAARLARRVPVDFREGVVSKAGPRAPADCPVGPPDHPHVREDFRVEVVSRAVPLDRVAYLDRAALAARNGPVDFPVEAASKVERLAPVDCPVRLLDHPYALAVTRQPAREQVRSRALWAARRRVAVRLAVGWVLLRSPEGHGPALRRHALPPEPARPGDAPRPEAGSSLRKPSLSYLLIPSWISLAWCASSSPW